MPRAAFYARYSSDKQRDASIEDQFRNCENYAKREELKVVGRYEDRGVSGADANRTGYRRMLADAGEEQFDVLVVGDLSRLSRDDVEFKQTIRRLMFMEVRVVGVSDGFDSFGKGARIHAGVRGLINDIYLEDLREKTHRGLAGRALEGKNTGGRCYGYRHLPIEDPNRKDEYGRPVILAVEREIDDEQAERIRWIFERYADGRSPRWIAAELNRLGMPSPRGGTWSGSAINGTHGSDTGLINNGLYIGKYAWNRSRWVRNPDTGKKTRRRRPKDEWIVRQMPHLRIVSDELWDRVKSRQREVHEKSANIRKALHKNARSGSGPKYLFSGLLKCGVCGGNYAISDRHRYGCSRRINRGPTTCANGIRVPRALVEDLLLESIKHDLFTPEAVELFVKETTRLLGDERARRQPNQEATRRRLAEVETEIENIVAAIKAGILTPTTKTELEKAEAERAELERTLSIDASILEFIPKVLPDAVERFQSLVADFENVAMRDVSRARTQIKKLIGGSVTLHPTEEGHLEAEMRGDYAGLIRLIEESPGSKRTEAGELSLVAGAGFEPATFRL